MEIRFLKMHGTHNDFIVLHDLDAAMTLSPDQIAAVCRPKSGVGADGLIIVRKSSSADFFMDYYNADGSTAEMCGNGIRCLAKYVLDNGLTENTTLPIETRAGLKTVEITAGSNGSAESVRVDMGRPVFEPRQIPVTVESDGSPILDLTVEADGRTFTAAVLSMGNPHCVIFPDGNPSDTDLEAMADRYGPVLEKDPVFPQKTNVEFARVDDGRRITMRVWERGSGRTMACGTGACATAVAAHLKGLADTECTLRLEGGDLHIEWKGMDNPVFMTGTATSVYKGIITV
jgi:diaminopimelate epimerase